MPSSHTVRMIDNENGNGNGNGSRSGFTSSSMPAFWSPKATSKISSSAAMLRIYNACNGTYYFICYVCPLSLSLTCRVCCPCLAAAVCHAVLPQQLTAGAGQAEQSQGKPSQDRPGQQEAVSAQTSLAYSCHVFLLPLPLPAPSPHQTPSNLRFPASQQTLLASY